jgi:hypothetical protein
MQLGTRSVSFELEMRNDPKDSAPCVFIAELGLESLMSKSNLSGFLKKLRRRNWKNVERILIGVGTMITVVSAAASAYYAYEAVQITLNPVTTVELGKGNFTYAAQGNVISETYTTAEFRISSYRYAIIYPYLIIDTHFEVNGRTYIFGPVRTDVVVDGVTRTILFPPQPFDP